MEVISDQVGMGDYSSMYVIGDVRHRQLLLV